MSRWSVIARAAGLLPMGFGASAMAQPVPQLEIDFVSATRPRSPLLSAGNRDCRGRARHLRIAPGACSCGGGGNATKPTQRAPNTTRR